MKRSIVAYCAVLSTVLFGFGACIKRQPMPEQGAPAATAPVGDLPSAPAEPTGNYGKVSGLPVLGGKGITAFAPHGETGRVEVSRVEVEGQPFTEAIRATIKKGSTNSWDVQLQARSEVPVERGDVLLATFYFRTEWAPQESGEGETEFVFELARDPWTKSTTYPVRAGRDWRKVFVPFVADQAYKKGEAQMIFRLGYPPQTIDIAGVSVENFGKQLALADLPVTKTSYMGREPDAPWRAEAARRIEKTRKAELKVIVRDATGKPVPGAQVRARLTRHEFGFGTCAPAAKFAGKGDPKFKELVPQLFNTVTLENDLKWVPLAGDWGNSFSLERAREAVAWLRGAHIDVRGHVLVWPGWRNLPASLRRLEKDPTRLRAEVDKHIRAVAGAMKGQLIHWDVLNEPFDNHDLMDILGGSAQSDWFKLARSTDPAAKLFINDYAILSGGSGSTPHRDHYEKTIKLLLDGATPIDGIGMQGHFGTSLTAPSDLLAILDRFAKFERSIWITEYDVVLADEELAGDYTRDFFTAVFSHPAVEGIVVWGFWDGSHWKNNAPLYRRDWSLKPAGRAYHDLVLKAWRTDEEGRTDPRGVFAARGFLGEYEVVVQAGSKQQTAKGRLAHGGSELVVKL